MRRFPLALAAFGLFRASALQADTSVVAGNRVTGGMLIQKTEYKTSEKISVEGQFAEAGYKYRVNPKFLIGAGLAFMFDGNVTSEFRNPNGGNGIRLFSDAQYELSRFDRNKIFATATFGYDRFNFSEAGVGASFSTMELKLGGLAVHYFSGLAAYGGIEYVGYSDGEFAYDDLTESAKRANAFNIRFGGAYRLNKKVAVTADVLFLGETTLFFAVDYAL